MHLIQPLAELHLPAPELAPIRIHVFEKRAGVGLSEGGLLNRGVDFLIKEADGDDLPGPGEPFRAEVVIASLS